MRSKKEDLFPRWYLGMDGHLNALILNIVGLILLMVAINAYLNMGVGYIVMAYLFNLGISLKY